MSVYMSFEASSESDLISDSIFGKLFPFLMTKAKQKKISEECIVIRRPNWEIEKSREMNDLALITMTR